ncbi:MAG: stage II sporulation protein M [Calditrichaceae bacterium]
MISAMIDRLDLLNFNIFLTSALFFFAGYALAPTASYKKIGWILAYPHWIVSKLDYLIKQKWNPVILFLFIFLVNGISLFINLLSGHIPGLPFLFALWMGVDIGVVSYETLEGKYFYTALLNPVALFELPAAFISFTMAFQYNLINLNIPLKGIAAVQFSEYIQLFIEIVLPLLLIAGILETALINFSQKLEDHKDL